jgi:hypothetical protein
VVSMATALTQPGELAYFKIGSMERVEYQEALGRAYRKHGVRASNPGAKQAHKRYGLLANATAEKTLLPKTNQTQEQSENGHLSQPGRAQGPFRPWRGK